MPPSPSDHGPTPVIGRGPHTSGHVDPVRSPLSHRPLPGARARREVARAGACSPPPLPHGPPRRLSEEMEAHLPPHWEVLPKKPQPGEGLVAPSRPSTCGATLDVRGDRHPYLAPQRGPRPQKKAPRLAGRRSPRRPPPSPPAPHPTPVAPQATPPLLPARTDWPLLETDLEMGSSDEEVVGAAGLGAGGGVCRAAFPRHPRFHPVPARGGAPLRLVSSDGCAQEATARRDHVSWTPVFRGQASKACPPPGPRERRRGGRPPARFCVSTCFPGLALGS